MGMEFVVAYQLNVGFRGLIIIGCGADDGRLFRKDH
jgi:hypothetical protein